MKFWPGWFLIAALTLPASLHAASALELDRDMLEQVEDLSESLANDLLELSIASRQRDSARVSRFVAEQVKGTPMPEAPAPAPETLPKGILRYEWPFETVSNAMPKDTFVARWMRFLDHFTTLEDVRLKVKQSTFAFPTAGSARVFFFVVGRNQEGHREWVRGYAHVRAARASSEAPWQIGTFELTEMHSLVSPVDLFSEVSAPAGVAVSVPAFGTAGNEGFVWHGAATVDVDRDGDLDIFATGYDRNYFYLNEGNGRFREVAGALNLQYLPSLGVAPLFLDYDNDGDADLFISAVGDQMLFENRLEPDGTLAFRDVSIESGVAHQAVGFSAVAGDVNGDGYPDIYVTSYNFYGQIMPNSWHQATNGTPNLLFVNQGDGTFREMAQELGVADSRWSYAAQFVDFDEDGDQDLYVANDYGENALYLNEDGHFRDVAQERGVLDPGNGMGVSFGDFDNDGDLDLHVTNMSSTAGNRILKRLFPKVDPQGNVLAKLASGDSLYENLGNGYFRNVTQVVGGFPGGWSWGGGFIDFDNDGWEDLYVPAGFISGKSMKDT